MIVRSVRRPPLRAGLAGLCALGLVAAAPAQAATPLAPAQRRELQQALDRLMQSRQAMATMVTDCNGGFITIIACPAPSQRPGASPGCQDAVASCDLVRALRSTDAAIAALQQALK